MSIAKGVDSSLFNKNEKSAEVKSYTEEQKLLINAVMRKHQIERVEDALAFIQEHLPDVWRVTTTTE